MEKRCSILLGGLVCVCGLNAGMASYASIPGGSTPYKQADSLFLEGVKWTISDQTDKALSSMEAALFANPQNAAACYGIASAKLNQKKWSEAIIYAEKAAHIEPRNKWYQVMLANLYTVTRQFPKAVGVYHHLLQLDSINIDISDKLAETYMMQGDMASAIRVYDDLEKKLEPCDEWSMKKYRLYNIMSKTKEAQTEIEKISRFIPGEPKYYEILAQQSIKEKNYDQAYEYYQKVVALKPEDPYTYASLADFYRKTDQEPKAIEAMICAVSSARLDLETKMNLLSSFFDNKPAYKFTENLLLGRLLDTMLVLYPEHWRLYYMKSFYYTEQGKIELARPLMKTYLLHEPHNPKMHEMLLYLDQRMGNWNLLAEDASTAIKFFPEVASSYVFAASAYHLLENCDSAIYYGEKAFPLTQYVSTEEKRNLRYVLYGILGDCYFREKEYLLCKKTMEAALTEYPEDPSFRNNYAYQLSLMRERLDEAIDWAQANCKSQPGFPTFWDTYAWALFQKGEYGQALSAIKVALRKGGSRDYIIWEHLGDILYHLGKTEKALEAWEKALELAGSTLPKNSVLFRKSAEKKWIETPY